MSISREAQHRLNLGRARLQTAHVRLTDLLQHERPDDLELTITPVDPLDPIASASFADHARHAHVVVINSDPEYLGHARLALQKHGYNVTTTNLVPTTRAMIEAGDVDVLVVDLLPGIPQPWSLVDELGKGVATRSLPIVFTSTNVELLAEATRQPWAGGRRFLFHKPYLAEDLADVVHSLIGPAMPARSQARRLNDDS